MSARRFQYSLRTLLLLPLFLAAVLAWRTFDNRWEGTLYGIIQDHGRVYRIDRDGRRSGPFKVRSPSFTQRLLGRDPYTDQYADVGEICWEPRSTMAVRQLGRYPGLRVLNIGLNKVDDGVLQFVATATDLETLCIEYDGRISRSGLDAIGSMSQLKRLAIRDGAFMSGEDAVALGQLVNLERISFGYTAISDDVSCPFEALAEATDHRPSIDADTWPRIGTSYRTS